MHDIAKKSRDALKDKARRLASGADARKVDCSDWSPAEPLNADQKTGARPVTKRQFNKGGKVVGKAEGAAVAFRADRKARKSGGRVEDKVKKASGGYTGGSLPDPKEGLAAAGASVSEKSTGFGKAQKASYAREEGYNAADRRAGRKSGGKVKKADGGWIDNIANALAGRGYIDGSSWISSDNDVVATDDSSSASKGSSRSSSPQPRTRAASSARPARRPTAANSASSLIPGADTIRQSDKFAARDAVGAKKGGKVEKRKGRATGGSSGSVQKLDSGMDDPDVKANLQGSSGRAHTGGNWLTKRQPIDSQFSTSGGGNTPRKGRATGGRAKSKGKTNIRINILAGQAPAAAPAPADAPVAPGAVPVPTPAPAPAPAAAAPAAMPIPIPMGGGQPPMGRKRGGRVYSSAKDMDAGAGSGEGRLEKTEIQKKKRRA